MPGNLIAFLLCCLLAWLLYHFRLRQAASRAEIRKLLPVYLVLAAFLAFNALLAWQGRAALQQAIQETPILTRRGLENAGPGAQIILDGTVSPENQALYWEYIAYIDDQRLYSPPELLIDLRDGVIAITNDDYAPRNWPLGTGYYPHLAAGERVIVVGTVERSVYLAGPNRGQESLSLHAEVVWAGSHADFGERARQRMVLPTVMWAANVAAITALAALCIAFWLTSSRPETKEPT
jgi:hypothetical protein